MHVHVSKKFIIYVRMHWNRNQVLLRKKLLHFLFFEWIRNINNIVFRYQHILSLVLFFLIIFHTNSLWLLLSYFRPKPMKNAVIKSFHGNVRKLVRHAVSLVLDIHVTQSLMVSYFLMPSIHYLLNCYGKTIFSTSFRMVSASSILNNIIYMYFIPKMFNIFGFLWMFVWLISGSLRCSGVGLQWLRQCQPEAVSTGGVLWT